MKNKEIEELLNDIKKQIMIDEKIGKEIAQDFHKTTLNYKETKLLLSYIEQLEKRNKELYEGFMATQEELTDYATKNEQLENNRDKAIEICDFYNKKYQKDPLGNQKVLFVINNIKDILKGDSDD